MSKYSASLFNILYSSTNSIIIIINGIILVPMYFRFMPVSTYGAWLATGNVVAMLGLVEAGFSSVVTQKMSVALADKDRNKFMQLASANLFTGFFMSLSIFVLGSLFSLFIADWINADDVIHEEITLAFIISLASSSISLIVSFLGVFPQVWQETRRTGFLSTIANIFGVISLILYLYLGYGVVALALGYLTRSIFNFLTLGVWVLQKWNQKKLPRPTFEISIIKILLVGSFYPFLSKISNVIMSNSQSFIIAAFICPSTAAVYDITSKIAVVGSNFVGVMNSSFFGLFSLTFASKNMIEINNLIKRVTLSFITILFSFLLYALVFTKPFVHFWVGLDKYGGDVLLFFIVLSLLITHFKRYFNNLLYTGGLIDKSAKLDIISMFLYVLLLLLLVEYAEIYAIPMAMSISGIFFVGVYFNLLKNHLFVDMQYMLRESLNLLLITVSFFLLHNLLKLNLLRLPEFILYVVFWTIGYISVLLLANRALLKELILQIGHERNT